MQARFFCLAYACGNKQYSNTKQTVYEYILPGYAYISSEVYPTCCYKSSNPIKSNGQYIEITE